MGVMMSFRLILSPKLRFKADPVAQLHFMIPYVFFPWISLSVGAIDFLIQGHYRSLNSLFSLNQSLAGSS